MGQSNMDGRALISKLPIEIKQPRNNVFIWWKGSWQPFIIGVNGNNSNSTLRCGPLASMAYYLSIKYPNDDLYFINQGIGGSSLYGGWKAKTGTNYKGCVNVVRTATNGIEFETRHGVWYQGETDSGLTEAIANVYELNEEAFISAIKSDLNLSTIVTCNISSNGTYKETVRNAKINNSDLYILEETIDINPTRLIHLTTPMVVILGQRISENL